MEQEDVAFERNGINGTAKAYELEEGFWRVRLYLNDPELTGANLDISVQAFNANGAVDEALDTFFERQRE